MPGQKRKWRVRVGRRRRNEDHVCRRGLTMESISEVIKAMPPAFGMPEPARELVIDSFCGGGGVSLGIEFALGRSPDIAINHDMDSSAMHRENHPHTLHLLE